MVTQPISLEVDPHVCRKDGLCAQACMRGILRQEERATVPRVEGAEHCYECGQCVAICPSGAIAHSSFPEGTVSEVATDGLPTYEQVRELIRTRRSKRLFKDEPIDRELIEQVLDVARFGPSGHNEQTTEFVVVQDPAVLQQIGRLTADGLTRVSKPYGSPIGAGIMRLVISKRGSDYLKDMVPELEGLVELYDGGTDWILREPAALVLFAADLGAEFFARVNANIALHNAALAAESLGLGCFYAGFVVLAADRDSSIARLVGLPDTHKVYGALALGHPRLRFTKWPERRPAKVAWV